MSSSTLNILVIAQDEPAAGGQLAQLLDGFLARGWRTTFAAPAVGGELGTGIALHLIEAGNIEPLVKALMPDVVVFDRYTTEEQYAGQIEQHCPDALRVLATGELHSLRDAREALLRRRLTFGLDPNDFRELFDTSGSELYQQMAPADRTQRELAAIFRSDLSLVASDVEMDLLINGFGVSPDLLHWSPPMLHLSEQAPRPFAERADVVCLIDGRQPADQDALLWLKHNIWPMARRRLPEAQLRVQVRHASAKAAALHDPVDGFLIEQDETALMGAARLYIAVQRFAAGIDGRVVDALMAGTPVIATPIAAEALHGGNAWPGVISSTAEGLAHATARLYHDEAAWTQAQRDARQLLGARCDQRRHSATLAQRIEQTLADLPAQRLYNFTGALLRRQRN